ncbi:MAG: tRNA (N6-isopentenyl adenosine(37)-C2)-methylthiotransferase MiaB [Planctomycetota bacterium]|nr:tRNA (N6-isopentenyl adenosine(37)-C2)-methylthiotransferase MiaB [Planctomycetota bacterium]MCX8039054.1 tRNA (N6-isopentenyl adenosine(37)-C2)-methylthiotransferase MiaB [Planctomycetota bacterium]MDW8372704.1 tRNA (N6-isopentenyl adenosine(37)-C2)-methylthiotransferase MiaB [Planctomycetota bacterium]
MPRTVFFETFGCQMNTADSEAMLTALRRAGWQPTEDVESADLVVFNTCAVRDHAEAKVRSRLGLLRELKQRRPQLRIALAGCMAQREGRALLARHPQLDLVVGTSQFSRLPELVERLHEEPRIAALDFEDWDERERADVEPAPGVNAFVPIMRGCNYTCTYCVVPMTRGREQSRRPEAIEAEVRRLVAAGYRQVTLLGQTVDAYGKTLGDGTTLAGLLRRLHAIDGLLRIRFVTSHPKDITDELLATIAELPKVARHLHVPAQSGSDRILRLMGRRYTSDEYLRLVERARRFVPDIELVSDFIVGFPTESDDDYAATERLLDRVGFAAAFVFMYSPRPGTPATRLADDVPEPVKRERCQRLLERQLAQQEAQHRALLGSVLPVLFEGPSKTDPGMLFGRSAGQRAVIAPRDDALIGRIVPVRIARCTALTLYGDPLP